MSTSISSAASPNPITELGVATRRLAAAVDRVAAGFQLNHCADRAGLTIERLLAGQTEQPAQALETGCAAYNLAEAVAEALCGMQGLLGQVRVLVEEWQHRLAASDRTSMRTAVEALAFEVEQLGAQADFKAGKLLGAVLTLGSELGLDDGLPVPPQSEFAEPIGTGRNDAFDIDNAIAMVSGQCAAAGNLQHRLEFAVNRLARHPGEMVGAQEGLHAAIPAAPQAESAVLAQPAAAPRDLMSLLR
jgi:flagellin-like hook-associated protein FlgL